MRLNSAFGANYSMASVSGVEEQPSLRLAEIRGEEK